MNTGPMEKSVMTPLELAHWILDPMTCNVDERHRAVAEALVRREEGVEPKNIARNGKGDQQIGECCTWLVRSSESYCSKCGTRLKWPEEPVLIDTDITAL